MSVIATVLFATMTAPGMAQSAYPTRSIQIIVPFTAGCGNDLLARMLADKLQKRWGQREAYEQEDRTPYAPCAPRRIKTKQRVAEVLLRESGFFAKPHDFGLIHGTVPEYLLQKVDGHGRGVLTLRCNRQSLIGGDRHRIVIPHDGRRISRPLQPI
jgi:hypothetical protein